MSGPKRSRYQVLGAAAEYLRAQRQLIAEREARHRAEVAETRRLERMETHRNVMLHRHKDVDSQLLATRGKMESGQFRDLEADSKLLQTQIRSATADHVLDSIEEQLVRFTKRVRTALSEMAQRAAIAQRESLRASVDALSERLLLIPERDALRVDANEYQNVKESIRSVDQHMASGGLRLAESSCRAAENCLSGFEQHYEEWAQEKETAERKVSECRASVEIVAQDICVATWRPDELVRMRAALESAEVSIGRGDWDSAAALCAEIRDRIDKAVAEANAEQLKADQRDYVGQSIAGVLEDMGFLVTSSLEHAGQPDTSVILSAVNAAGQVVAVSVPVEGDVYYDVNGYPMRSEPTEDGVMAPTCDEAQAVIENLHGLLAQGYDVQMGELLWQGKPDPDRLLRKADQRPDNSSSEQGGLRR